MKRRLSGAARRDERRNGKTASVRVLIAEDEPRLAALLTEAVSESGWDATVRTTGPTALAAARTGDFDVLLLDWMLPGLEGPAVIATLRAEGHRIPVLLLTARGDVRDRVDGLNAGPMTTSPSRSTSMSSSRGCVRCIDEGVQGSRSRNERATCSSTRLRAVSSAAERRSSSRRASSTSCCCSCNERARLSPKASSGGSPRRTSI